MYIFFLYNKTYLNHALVKFAEMKKNMSQKLHNEKTENFPIFKIFNFLKNLKTFNKFIQISFDF